MQSAAHLCGADALGKTFRATGHTSIRKYQFADGAWGYVDALPECGSSSGVQPVSRSICERSTSPFISPAAARNGTPAKNCVTICATGAATQGEREVGR